MKLEFQSGNETSLALRRRDNKSGQSWTLPTLSMRVLRLFTDRGDALVQHIYGDVGFFLRND
jgi:hypothetical protein